MLSKPVGGRDIGAADGARIKCMDDSKLVIIELPTEIKPAKYLNQVISLYFKWKTPLPKHDRSQKSNFTKAE